MIKPYVIGVAGGSGSGKTYFAKALQKVLGADRCLILYQDNYYLDQSARFNGDGGDVNFDHPDSLEFSLLAQDLAQLRMGLTVDVPTYDFVTHSRLPETIRTEPRPIILVDGILILNSPEVRAQLHDGLFFDTPEDIRFARRLARDVHERGRTESGVRKQFELQVRPMHNQFVEPSKIFAERIVKDLTEFGTTLSEYSRKLQDGSSGIAMPEVDEHISKTRECCVRPT